jgi:hypothetical protein
MTKINHIHELDVFFNYNTSNEFFFGEIVPVDMGITKSTNNSHVWREKKITFYQ